MAKAKKFFNPVRVDVEAVMQTMQELGVKTPGRVLKALENGAPQEELDDLILTIVSAQRDDASQPVVLKNTPLNYPVYGEAIIEAAAKEDMNLIARLPFVEQVALMPDAHRVSPGHVPVGGVVLARDCILPGVVGSDIACSVCYTTTNVPVDADWFAGYARALEYVLREYTYFGQQMNPVDLYGSHSHFQRVMGDRNTPLLRGASLFEILKHDESRRLLGGLLGVARNHFGTSGDGNHFVEFGHSTLKAVKNEMLKSANSHFAILSHFGSRGVGGGIADYFRAKANELHPMPKQQEDNAPLFFTDDDGWAEDYLMLMGWAGEFAKMSHQWLHKRLRDELVKRGLLPETHDTAQIYTRHNFAWMIPEGIIHRKGATPAEAQEYGVIPATMGHHSKIVLGRGNADYLNSASHGAGRKMSRGNALKQIPGSTHEYVKKEFGITLLGGDKDEDPRAYKDINAVMRYQAESVQEIGEFAPVVVRMADPRFAW